MVCVLRRWHSNYNPTLLFLFVFYHSLSGSHPGAIHQADGAGLWANLSPEERHGSSHLSLPFSFITPNSPSSRAAPSPLSTILRLVRDGRRSLPLLLFSATHSITLLSLSLSVFCSSLFGVFVCLIFCLCLQRFAGCKEKKMLLERIFVFTPLLS